MADFTSALYLGMHHASRFLPGWDRLTMGKPAALEDPPGAGGVERQLAELIGCKRALLATSTLHVFWDLFAVLARKDVNIFLDAGAYPIIRWGVERVACSGTPVTTFGQHDPNALRKALDRADSRPPVVVTDGYSPGLGRMAPIAQYLAQAATRGGFVVVDDSQALGIFGKPTLWLAYGLGGGGSMQHTGLTSDRSNADRLIVGASLAKAFGVPIAVLAGSVATINSFADESATRVHCSPPSAADVAACSNALAINRTHGDLLRTTLARNVSLFRQGLRRLGLIGVPDLFPVQPLRLPEDVDACSVHEELSRRGIHSILHRGERGKGERISFIITARHSAGDIRQALVLLAEVLAARRRNTNRKDLRRWSIRITTQGA